MAFIISNTAYLEMYMDVYGIHTDIYTRYLWTYTVSTRPYIYGIYSPNHIPGPNQIPGPNHIPGSDYNHIPTATTSITTTITTKTIYQALITTLYVQP